MSRRLRVSEREIPGTSWTLCRLSQLDKVLERDAESCLLVEVNSCWHVPECLPWLPPVNSAVKGIGGKALRVCAKSLYCVRVQKQSLKQVSGI